MPLGLVFLRIGLLMRWHDKGVPAWMRLIVDAFHAEAHLVPRSDTRPRGFQWGIPGTLFVARVTTLRAAAQKCGQALRQETFQ